jgi:hypothetical protein
MKHKKLFGGVGIVVIVLAIVAFALTRGTDSSPQTSQTAQEIPEGTYFNEVKTLSAGSKPACLTPDPALTQIVEDDDKLPFEKSFSVAIGSVIPDMPAGFTDVYLHEYSATKARGYEVFSDQNQQSFVGDLAAFNFTIERASANNQWKLQSFIACTKQG